MNAVKTLSGVVTRPVHAAASLAGRAVGLSLGATKAGVRTTGRLVEWAADRGMSTPKDSPASPAQDVTPSPVTTTSPAPSSMPAAVVKPAAQAAPVAAPAGKARSQAQPKAKAKTKGTQSSVPTPADVKPAIDRSAPLEAEAAGESVGEPLGAAETGELGKDEVRTASGIPAADVGVNPATGLPNRYDTEPEPLLDPGTVKAVQSESDMLQRAAEEKPAAKPAKAASGKSGQKG